MSKNVLLEYYKATDYFIDKFFTQISAQSLSLEDFCEINKLDLYMTQKVLDKQIKMGVTESYLIKLADLAKVSRGTILGEQPISKIGIDYSQRKKIRY